VSRPPRGTTVRLEHRPGRSKPWGAIWNKYREGHAGRPQPLSEWFADEGEARAFAEKLRAALLAGAPPLVPEVPIYHAAGTLGALAPQWLADVLADRDKATHDAYADTIRNWVAPAKGHARYPGFGTILVTDAALTTVAIAAWLKGLQRSGASLSTRKRSHRAISAFCSWARANGYLTIANPAFGLGRGLRHKDDRLDEDADVHPFTLAQVTEIFDVIKSSEEVYLPYFQFLHDVGVRPGEAAALKWTALDLDGRMARIELSYSMRARADKDPKTHEKRDVFLTAAVVDLLRVWRQVQRKEALRRGVKVPEYVFTTLRMARILQDGNIQYVCRRILDAAKIDGHRLYDFRHTFATSHLSANWEKNLPLVSRQLGHKNSQTTIDHYFAWRPTTAAAGFVDEIRNYR